MDTLEPTSKVNKVNIEYKRKLNLATILGWSGGSILLAVLVLVFDMNPIVFIALELILLAVILRKGGFLRQVKVMSSPASPIVIEEDWT